MIVVVNGRDQALPGPATVADLLAAQLSGRAPAGIAVAVNGCVVPRDRHAAVPLADGDRVDIVTAVQGG